MIHLEYENVVIKDVLADKYVKPTHIDEQFVDFDGVRYHMHTQESKNVIVLSMDIRCWSELASCSRIIFHKLNQVKCGAQEIMTREYPDHVMPQAEAGYSVSLQITLDQLPSDAEQRTQLIKKFSLLKRNALAAPFERAFDNQKQLESNPPEAGSKSPLSEFTAIHYRPEEAIYVSAGTDRVTVVFSTVFKEETDRVFGKVFLQEFADARKLPAIQAAPQVLYSLREPPLEIRHLPSLQVAENVGYVTFVLFPRHFATADRKWETISRIMLFRDYLHYHIKCSKAYMHSRMRHRVAEFLKVLNRAKPEIAEKERRTATGRTFVRS